MRAVLIDNATLTAVQRLLGEAPSRSKEIADGDIVALENLLQAVLLYDVVLCLDDYKTQYKESRKRAFPYIGWVDVQGPAFVEAFEHSKEVASKLRPKVKAGRFADPVFSEIVDRLKLNMAFAWDMSTSVYYLQFRMLGAHGEAFDRYRTEVQEIFSEVGGSQHHYKPPPPQLVDRFGKEIGSDYTFQGRGGEAKGMSSAMETFISALSWLALNSIYYGECSRLLKCDLLLHPIRHEFHILHASRSGDLDIPHKKLLLSRLEDRISSTVESVWSGANSSAYGFKLPIFAAWFASKGLSVKDMLQEALSVRRSEPFMEARKQLLDLDVALNQDYGTYLKKANKLIEGVDRAFSVLARDYGVSTRQGQTSSNIIQVTNLAASVYAGMVPSAASAILKAIKLPDFAGKHVESLLVPRRGLTPLYKSVTSDLIQVSRLGRINDQLKSSVRVDGSLPSARLRVEAERFFDKPSDITEPM